MKCPPTPTSRDTLRGILFMLLAMILFPFLNASVKLLSGEIDTPMIVWARYTGHFVWMLIAFLPSYGWRLFETHNLRLQIVRSLLLLGATVAYFNALIYIPLATAAIIGFSAPFIVTALSVPILGEPVGWRRWAAVAVGFVGTLIVLRPGTDSLHPAALLVVGTAACNAAYQVLTRKVTFTGRDSAATTITYTAIVGALLTSALIPFHWQPPETPKQWILLVMIGFIGGFGHYFVVKAFQYAQAAVVAPLQYGQILGATLLGYLFFDDLPDRWTWAGSAIIIACGLYIGYRETRPRR